MGLKVQMVAMTATLAKGLKSDQDGIESSFGDPPSIVLIQLKSDQDGIESSLFLFPLRHELIMVKIRPRWDWKFLQSENPRPDREDWLKSDQDGIERGLEARFFFLYLSR